MNWNTWLFIYSRGIIAFLFLPDIDLGKKLSRKEKPRERLQIYFIELKYMAFYLVARNHCFPFFYQTLIWGRNCQEKKNRVKDYKSILFSLNWNTWLFIKSRGIFEFNFLPEMIMANKLTENEIAEGNI